MIKKQRFPGIFFGWWTVLTSGILGCWVAGFQIYGFSALFKPIASELGFNRAVTSVAAGIGRLGGGFESLLAGWIADKFGPRLIVFCGIFLFGLGMILMNFIHSLWAYYFVWGVLVGTGTNFIMGMPLNTAISNWFVKKRGLALGIKWMIIGVGVTMMLPMIVARLIVTQGWRMACVIGGLLMWIVGFPLSFLTVKQHRPEYYGLLPDGAAVDNEAGPAGRMIDQGVKYAAEIQEVEFTLKQAMRTPTFWLLIIAQSINALALPAIRIHGIPFLTDLGIDPIKAAGMMSLMVFSSLPSRLIGGLTVDRLEKKQLRFLLGGAYFLPTLGFALILLNQSFVTIYAWFILYGIGGIGSIPLNFMIRARYFGRKAYGAIGGSSQMFIMPVGLIAPIYLGWVYDTTGSYLVAFTLVTVLLAIGTILMCLIPPPG